MSTIKYPANCNTLGEVANAISKFYDDIAVCAKTTHQVLDQTTNKKLHCMSWCSMELVTDDGLAWGLDPWDRF